MKYIKKIDYVSSSSLLFINNKRKLKTHLGGILSLVSIMTVSFFIWYLGYDVVYKQKPRVIPKEEYLKNSYIHNLNIENSFMALSIVDYNLEQILDIDKILTVKIFSTHYTKSKEGGNEEIWDTQYINYNTTTCDNYKLNKNNSLLLSEYSINELKTMMCPENYNITLGGTWTENNLYLLTYYIYLCDNKTDSEEKSENDVVCYPRETQLERINGNYISIYYRDFLVDPKDIDEPIKPFAKTNYMIMDSFLYKEMEVFFKTIVVNTDSGFFLEDISSEHNIMFDKYTVDTRSLVKYDSEILVASLWINSGSKTMNIDRSYIKIQEIAANVGGIIKFITLLCNFILYKVNKKTLSLEIMNNLYNFELNSYEKSAYKSRNNDVKNNYNLNNVIYKVNDNSKISNLGNSLNDSSKIEMRDIYKNNYINPNNDLKKKRNDTNINNADSIYNSSNFKLLNKSKKFEIISKINNDNISKHIEKIQERKQTGESNNIKIIKANNFKVYGKLHYNSFELFKSIYCSFFNKGFKKNKHSLNSKYNLKEEYYYLFNKKINSYINIESIAKKLYSIEHLKEILFNENQYNAFNHIGKQDVNIDLIDEVKYGSLYMNKENNNKLQYQTRIKSKNSFFYKDIIYDNDKKTKDIILYFNNLSKKDDFIRYINSNSKEDTNNIDGKIYMLLNKDIVKKIECNSNK